MAALSGSFTFLLSIFCAVCLISTVSGDCSFPVSYTNRFWFRMYLDSSLQKYIYRQFTTNVADNRSDNVTSLNSVYPCSSVTTDPADPNTLYYLYNDYGSPTCAKSVITSDASAILGQEVSVSKSLIDASQCSSAFTASCTTCGALWMPAVNSLSQPPSFGSSLCPFPGLFQLTASYNGSSVECSGDVQSTAVFYGSTIQMNLCGQGSLRNMTFKSRALLQDPLTCMASLDGKALNANEAGSTIVLIRDNNVLYCARFKNVSGGFEVSINVKNDTYFAGCSFNASTTYPVLQLTLSPITSTPGPPTTTTPLSTTTLPTRPTTPVTSTTTLPSPSTSTSTSISTSISTITTTTPQTTTTTTVIILPSPTTTTVTTISAGPTSGPTNPTPSTITTLPITITPTTNSPSWVTPGPSRSTSPGMLTTGGVSKGPPDNIEGPTDNCPTTACASPATCNEATHNCSCRSVFYTYSNSSKCIQDDRAIDDTFLKIVVPIIAIAAAGSLIAGLALCFATRPLDAVALDGAALAAASADNAVPAVQSPIALPATQLQEQPVFVNYVRNDTYANVDTIDRSLVTYGGQPAVPPPSNYVMVGSSIPAKM